MWLVTSQWRQEPHQYRTDSADNERKCKGVIPHLQLCVSISQVGWTSGSGIEVPMAVVHATAGLIRLWHGPAGAGQAPAWLD